MTIGESEMAQKSYADIIREQLHGNKYLETGEVNPNYDRYWGLKKGSIKAQAKAYAKEKDIFIPQSTTDKPIEFIMTGIISEKSQYQFMDIEEGLGKNVNRRQVAVDIARMSNLIEKTSDMDAIEYKHKDENGNEVTEMIMPPWYYAEQYAEGKISRQEFFDYVEIWKFGGNNTRYINDAYGKI